MSYMCQRGYPTLVLGEAELFIEARNLSLQNPRPCGPSHHEPSEGQQIFLSNRLDLYHKSLDSGELQYNSRTLKRRFDQ